MSKVVRVLLVANCSCTCIALICGLFFYYRHHGITMQDVATKTKIEAVGNRLDTEVVYRLSSIQQLAISCFFYPLLITVANKERHLTHLFASSLPPLYCYCFFFLPGESPSVIHSVNGCCRTGNIIIIFNTSTISSQHRHLK